MQSEKEKNEKEGKQAKQDFTCFSCFYLQISKSTSNNLASRLNSDTKFLPHKQVLSHFP